MIVSRSSFPEYVFPLGVRFRVELVDHIDDDGSVGEMIGDLRLIRILSSLDTRRRWATLLHEFFHATLYVIGISNEMDHQLEEVIVQSAEHSMEQFMTAHGSQYIEAVVEVQR